MTLVERVQAIITKPKETWPALVAEAQTVGSLYTSYIIPLAAIPAVSSFIGFSIVGTPILFVGTVRLSILGGIEQAISTFVLALVGVYVAALVADALAPSFSGTRNQMNALKLITYSAAPMFLAGVVLLVPAIGFLGIVGLYGFYLMYLGVPTTMNVPEEKEGAYTVVVIIVAAFVLTIILGFSYSLTNALNPTRIPALY